MSESNIHIMTSVKGGVGKTLLSLAVFCSYLHGSMSSRSKLLCVDMNTMNNDFYKLLAGNQVDKVVPGDASWRFFDGLRFYVARRNEPFQLFNGAKGFWENLSSLVNNDKFRNNDVVVDTNIHLLNFNNRSADVENLIATLFEGRERKIYFWIIWTFASLINAKEIEQGIYNVKDLYRGEDHINFVHVLNPSALTPPRSKFWSVVEALAETRNQQERILKLKEGFEAAGNQRAVDLTEELLHELPFPPILPPDIDDVATPFPGLAELITGENASDALRPGAFIAIMQEYIKNLQGSGEQEDFYTDASKLANAFTLLYENEFKGKGRPSNLLPISMYDPRLTGYTEYVTQPKIEDICSTLSNIAKDVDLFLEHLR